MPMMDIIENNDSMVDMLFHAYVETYNKRSPEFCEYFRTLKTLVKGTGVLSKEQADKIWNHATMMCWEHKKSGFAAGMKLATRLYIELTTGELGEVMEP